ncbi:MAG: helix-turn-helix domain-containing protein [archaeon]|nr:helix-turn-helix domain-containing protein [archaeon]
MKDLSQQPLPTKLKVEFENCPVQASLGVLGRKWSLLVLRNIELFDKHRFNEMLKVTPGITKRVLSIRLRELEREGFIEVSDSGRNYLKWDLTEKGKDVLPILMMLAQFGSKWYADQVFADKTARSLGDVFDESYIRQVMRTLEIQVPLSAYVELTKR